jgi:uncharacterized membrane protein
MRPHRFLHTVDIAAPAAVVFGLTTDIESWPRMMPTVTSVERLDGGPLQRGSRARLKQPGQRATIWTVTGVDADRCFVWEGKLMGVRTVATHTVTTTSTGCTNELGLELLGRGAGVLSALIGRSLRRVLETENSCFRREAEAVEVTRRAAPAEVRDSGSR